MILPPRGGELDVSSSAGACDDSDCRAVELLEVAAVASACSAPVFTTVGDNAVEDAGSSTSVASTRSSTALSPNEAPTVCVTVSGTTILRFSPGSHNQTPDALRTAYLYSTALPTSMSTSARHSGKSSLLVMRGEAAVFFQFPSAAPLPSNKTTSPGRVCSARTSNRTRTLSAPPRSRSRKVASQRGGSGTDGCSCSDAPPPRAGAPMSWVNLAAACAASTNIMHRSTAICSSQPRKEPAEPGTRGHARFRVVTVPINVNMPL